MLAEGVPAAMIENLGRMAGMPVGPLSLNDEVAVDHPQHWGWERRVLWQPPGLGTLTLGGRGERHLRVADADLVRQLSAICVAWR